MRKQLHNPIFLANDPTNKTGKFFFDTSFCTNGIFVPPEAGSFYLQNIWHQYKTKSLFSI